MYIIRAACVFALALFRLCAAGQILPDEGMQRRMLAEEQAFLAGMESGLQHRQALAVRAAIGGDFAALEEIRASRNKQPVLPESIATFRPRKDICVFAPCVPPVRKRPLLLYLHGGGWCFGSTNSCARFCAALALEGDCCVAALDYRLSPAYPFPAPLDDCRDALAYVRQHADGWGCDSARVSVGGDSAGGNLALATAMAAPGVCRVAAVYPVTKLFKEEIPSWTQYATGYGDDGELLEAFCEAYAKGRERDPLASVALAADSVLRALPPVLVISAGHDVLFDQTAEFARRLRRLGCPLSYHVYPTATHLFVTVPGQPTAFAEAVGAVAAFLNEQ